MKKQTIMWLSLAVSAAALAATDPQPNLIGYLPVTIKPGTNIVENLPATPKYLPELHSFT